MPEDIYRLTNIYIHYSAGVSSLKRNIDAIQRFQTLLSQRRKAGVTLVQ